MRRVFFSFHYKMDAWRAANVRNAWKLDPNLRIAGHIDAAEWETLERKGQRAIRNWIDGQLKNTSVTAVLIGSETARRPWVKYEIQASKAKGNALLGIRIHNVKDQRGKTSRPGANPLRDVPDATIYDWVNDEGRLNMANWVERAHRIQVQGRRGILDRLFS